MAFHQLIPITLRFFTTLSNYRAVGRPLRLVPSIFEEVTFLAEASEYLCRRARHLIRDAFIVHTMPVPHYLPYFLSISDCKEFSTHCSLE
ncbi:hypothetical protein TNIN_174951 [Trichonephila inaurata madagascariensis]|uniref:Uncharacterized protein n=1 Tax=Trichonephila inaurata madagascariensis TaxID=2747483 RepID=A0A8X6YX41_9ARAC|nr:hypothetical protein TNIN_174951 [Trichonephila inaurata madagascariensis]